MSAIGSALAALNAIDRSIPAMDPLTRGGFVVELLRTAFAACDKLDPHIVDEIAIATCGHLRALRPEQMGPLGTLPDPTEPNRDPRA